jgi:hypothetical protein
MIQRILLMLAMVALVLWGAACSHQDPLSGSDRGRNPYLADKDGTEELGTPSISISSGSGFAEGGVGLEGVESAQLDIEVPAGATINQVLLYWSGAADGGPVDDEITLDGTPVQGQLIGGPTLFFGNYEFSAYRADITEMGLIVAGANSVTVAGFDNPTTWSDEDNGASILVIYEDGPAAVLELRDGLDMAYFGFQPTLDATVPQVFSVIPSNSERTAELLLMVSSVGENRPNSLRITTAAGEEIFENVLNSTDGPAWDSQIRSIDIPAGVDEVAVQIISTDTMNPQGASMGWVVAGLAIEDQVQTYDVSGTVYIDADENQTQGIYELGIANVTVQLKDGTTVVDQVVTGDDGAFAFSAAADNFTVEIPLGATPDQFNYDIAQSFAPTSGLVIPVTAGSGSEGLEFGFVPRPGDILADLESGELVTNGQSISYWLKVLRRTIIQENSGRQASGHDGDGHDGPEAWGHPGWYPSPDEMRGLILVIEGLFLTEPYQFTEGNEVEEVYQILRTKMKTDYDLMIQEMLVSELNYVAGLGLINEEDRLGVLISWGEALANINPGPVAKSGEKDYKSDIRSAFQIFKAVNTGGGGGVDE